MGKGTEYTNYRWLLLLSGCVAICSIYIDMISYAPILGEVAKDLKVEMGSATNLMMGFVLAVACVLVWGGVVCDKFGITAALVLGLLCSTVPTALIPWIGNDYQAVFLTRLVQGASVGFVFATVGPILARWFPPEEQGLASGLFNGSISLGSAIGVFVSPTVFGATHSWQKTIFLMGTPGWLALALALLITGKIPPAVSVAADRNPVAAAGGEVTFLQALCYPMTWIGAVVAFCNCWGLFCLYNLVPPFLASGAPMGVGLGPLLAGKLSVAVTIVGVFSVICGGIFFDKFAKGSSRVAPIAGFVLSGICAPLILIPLVSSHIFYLAIFLMCAGWGIPFMMPSLSAFVAMNYPPRIVGRMMGLWFGLGTFGGAAGLYLGGISISKSGNFNLAIGLISLAALVGIGFSCILKANGNISLDSNLGK